MCFAATFAWFYATKKSLDGAGINMQIESHELRLTYNIYKFDDNLKQITEVNNLNLNPYDTVIKERNDNNAIIIKATLQSDLFEGKTVSDVNIQAHCLDAYSYTDSRRERATRTSFSENRCQFYLLV